MVSLTVQQTISQPLPSDEFINSLPSEYYEYLIITDSSLAHVFQRLVSYKSQFLPSKLITLDTILNNESFNGRDTQEKIRNFILFAHENWKTRFVLLGGDDSIIPHRNLYGEMIDWQGRYRESNFPSDMYYGCLDGNWDNDEDFIFGEEKQHSSFDEADFKAEVFIGRAPVENSYEASVFINKIIFFETSEKPKKIQLHQSGLNTINEPSSTKIVENCAKWIPTDEYEISKFYSVFQNITVQKWIDSFNAGQLIIQHAGNGAKKQYDLDNIDDNEVWTIQNISDLRNNFFPIHFSLACHSGDFTVDDCLAEKMLLYPYGGTSACIFNSNFGATDEVDASLYSGEFIERQFYEIFENNTIHLGEIVQKSKEHFAPLARENPKYRWCYYTINLMGDPESPVLDQRDYESTSILSVDDDFDESTKGWNITRFSSIQSAINEITEGGTILVYNGEYHEHITISKSVYLFGTNKNFEDDEPYSGLTELIGDETNNVVNVTADNVYIDGFIIKQAGNSSAGILLENVNNTYIYRCDVVSNKGNGIMIRSCNNCNVFDSSISFNGNNGIFLQNSHNNFFGQLNIAYNKKNGFYLYKSNKNNLVGLLSTRESPTNFYGSKILIKYQDLELNTIEDLNTYVQLILQESYYDALEYFYYFPVRPPTSTGNILTYDYFLLYKNNNGIVIEDSYNNSIRYSWIESKEDGIGIELINCSASSNQISQNYIYNNRIGIYAENSTITNIFQNNLYSNEIGLSFTDCTGISTDKANKFNFLIGGNSVFNEKNLCSTFQWYYFDNEKEMVFIDIISLAMITGYITTNIFLTFLTIAAFTPSFLLTKIILLTMLCVTISIPFLFNYNRVLYTQNPQFF